jgi:hypothetical protein
MKLREHVGWSSPQIDEENGVISDVKILGFTSKNNRTYRREAFEQGQNLYEGKGVNLDHRSKGQRTVSDAFGRFREVYIKEDGLYAKRFEYLTSHPFAGQFVETAQRMPEQLGFSHVAEGEVVRKGKEESVESIDVVESVDLVRYPASVKGLFEAEAIDDSSGALGVRGHLRASIRSLVEDESLPVEEMRTKIMAVIETEKKVTTPAPAGEGKTEKLTEGNSESKEGTEDKATDILAAVKTMTESIEKATESLKSLRSDVDQLQRQQQLTECVQSHTIDMSKVTDEQLTQLREAKTREDMDKIAEGLPDFVRSQGKPSIPAGKAGNVDYSTLREELAEEYEFTQ